MGKYQVVYEGMDNAITTTEKYQKELENIENKIKDCCKTLQNENDFMGPICETYVGRNSAKIPKIHIKVAEIIENLGIASDFLNTAKENYMQADNDASKEVKLDSKLKINGYKLEIVDNTLDMSNYPTGTSIEEGIERATLVAEYLVENGNFTKEQAAAIVGVYVDENKCDPASYMKEEKEGLGAAGTGGNGYGAGIASWTREDFKNQCLEAAGIPKNTPIESLSLEQQADMVIAMSNSNLKTYYNALRRCDSIEDASATAVIITGGVGYSNNWDTHPTQAEAKAMSDSYGMSNDARFGASEYHWNLDTRRLDYAKKVYEKMQ